MSFISKPIESSSYEHKVEGEYNYVINRHLSCNEIFITHAMAP